jgi:pilus assembly protein FimV
VRFVLDVRTPAGRWVRDYTALFDSPAAKVQAAPAAAVSQHPARVKVPAGATLASIAKQVQPAGVSLNQTMAALFLENPDKFRNQDPQHLLPGSELNVPPAERMHALTEARVRMLLQRPGGKSLSLPPGDVAVAHAASKKALATTAPVPAPQAAAVAEPSHANKKTPHVSVEPKPATEPKPTAAAGPLDGSPQAIEKLQQLVIKQDQELQGATKRVNDRKQKIKDLEAASQPAKALVAKPLVPAKKSWLIWGGGAAGVLLLLGLLFWLWRRRAGRAEPDGVPHAASLSSTGVVQPDPSVAGHAAGNVLAEAEVYLAYQHDQQAEDILRQGLEQDPSRQDLRTKLLELYAARPDLRKFELLAIDVYEAYDGRGAAWERTRAMGLAIDPDNPLYQPGGSPETAQAVPSVLEQKPVEAAGDMTFDFDVETAVVSADSLAAEPDHSMLDFDFSLDGPAPAGVPVASADETPAVVPEVTADLPVVDLAARMAAAVSAEQDEVLQPGFDAEPLAVVATEQTAAALAAEPMDEALSTKLDLARVYLDMGDSDGAREVLLELQGEASGAMKQQVDALLASLAAAA